MQFALILVVMMTVFPVSASEITGAFGFVFGDKVDTRKYKQQGLDNAYGLKYAFIPENPFKPLDSYTMYVTPETHRVYQISASATFTSDKACLRVLVELEQALEKKYDKTSKKIHKDFGSLPEISFGKSSRTIEANCSGFLFSKKLKLVYLDKQLREQGGKEYRQAHESGNASGRQGNEQDTSGL